MGLKIEDRAVPALPQPRSAASATSPKSRLDRAMAPMGSNFGDVDNDGYLDIYWDRRHVYEDWTSTHVQERGGRRFEDITVSSAPAISRKGTASRSRTGL